MSQRSQNQAAPAVMPARMTRGMIARWVVLVVVLLAIPAVGFVWIIQKQSDPSTQVDTTAPSGEATVRSQD